MGSILPRQVGKLLRPILLVLLALVLVTGCSLGGDDDEDASGTAVTTDAADTTQLPPSPVDTRLTVVASSSAREVYDRLGPLFNRTPEGEGVLVEAIYGNMLETVQHVGYGLETNVYAPLSEGDLPGLVESGQVPRDWNDDEFGGMVSTSLVVFAVRTGNPKAIRNWADLTKPGVRIVVADPEFSGISRWATLAAYASELEPGGTPDEARQFLRRVLANVTLAGTSGRESLTAFTRGNADVLLTSEAEAITAREKGAALEYVIPDETLLIENPIIVIPGSPPQADAFVDFLRSEEAQRVYAEEGHRPVLESAAEGLDFPTPPSVVRLRDLGSPREVYIEHFGSAASTVPSLLLELGKARVE